MTTTIYKYPLPGRAFQLNLPVGFHVLDVQVQPSVGPVLWAMVDPSLPTKLVTFQVVATGVPCEGLDPSMYVGTFQLHNEAGSVLVWHVFCVQTHPQA